MGEKKLSINLRAAQGKCHLQIKGKSPQGGEQAGSPPKDCSMPDLDSTTKHLQHRKKLDRETKSL